MATAKVKSAYCLHPTNKNTRNRLRRMLSEPDTFRVYFYGCWAALSKLPLPISLLKITLSCAHASIFPSSLYLRVRGFLLRDDLIKKRGGASACINQMFTDSGSLQGPNNMDLVGVSSFWLVLAGPFLSHFPAHSMTLSCGR